MSKKNIEIKFVKNWPEEEIIELYKAGGWWKEQYSQKGIKPLIQGSFAFAVVVDNLNGKTVGMGRIISDGTSDAYIQDLVVLPEYRKKGIGRKLVETLLNHCLSNDLIWIGLISEPGQEVFYKSLGFKNMKNHTPMLYSKAE